MLMLKMSNTLLVIDSRRVTPLHDVSYKGHVDIANALIRNGADVDAKDM